MNKKRLTVLMAGLMALIPLSWASISSAKDKDVKEIDRIQNAATVLKEILDIPDDIPQDLLDKARCVMVYPSIVKAAFIVGGSYGRDVNAEQVITESRFQAPPEARPLVEVLQKASPHVKS